MPPSQIERFRMETNFEGLIQLLAKHLYPEPDVFVREIIQNGQDAIQRRLKVDPDVAGKIDLVISTSSRTLTFRDNGIGMDKSDIHEFLSVIGSSGTLAAIQQWRAEGYEEAQKLIGQFGIGFLSGFLVADQIVVRTRKTGSNTGFRWRNGGSLECELQEEAIDSVGTEIIIHVGQNHAYFLDERRLRDVVHKYCGFIPFNIYLNGNGPVNEADAPFYRSSWPSESEKIARYEAFVGSRYPDIPLAVIPVEVRGDYSAQGVLYISDRSLPEIDARGVVEVVIRRMMIKPDDTNLLPKWATFVRGVIDSPDLAPTAARDGYQLEHPSVEYLRRKIGDVIVQRMITLSKQDPVLFRRINRWHHYHLKGMACVHDDFFRQVEDLLLFETNKGQMPLSEYLTKNARRVDLQSRVPIYYFSGGGSATQFNRLADGAGWTVIDGSGIFDTEFLKKYSHNHERAVVLIHLDSTDDAELFHLLSSEEHEKFRSFQQDVQGHLAQFGLDNIRVRMRRFTPVEVPAVIIVHKRTEHEEKLRNLMEGLVLASAAGDIVDELLQDSEKLPLYLNLNADNQIIRKLADTDRRSKQLQLVMTGVYNCALVHAHNLLNEQNTRVMHDQFINIMMALIESEDINVRLREDLEAERQLLLKNTQVEALRQMQRPDHIRLFMITPFSKEYEPLEDAIREIFETHPFYFEVLLARDYTFEAGLLDNIREHIERSHGFIAEITDLNANVMFELGAVMLREDGRPVFTLRAASATLPVPVDLREKLRIEYSSVKQSACDLATEIRAFLERDGRIIHDDIRALVETRKKRFFSRRLLESLAVRLSLDHIAGLRREFSSVEDFLAADIAIVSRKTRVPAHLLQALCGELQLHDVEN